jgi:CHASE3 domain sensor protein
VPGGLTRRMVVASGLLALVVGAAFAVLLSSVADLRASEHRARLSEEVLVVANRLERLVVDLETGQRGFIITGQERFLEPWHDAQIAIPEQARSLERLVAGNLEQLARAQRIAQATTSYLREYSVPLVATARRDLAAAQTVAATEEGKQRVDAIRAEFDRFVETERGLAVARQRRSDVAAQQAIVAAAAGLGGSILLVVLFAGYLTRAIVQPVRRRRPRRPHHRARDRRDRGAGTQLQHHGKLPGAQPRGARGLAGADRGRRRPGTAADRARPARRHPAAAGVAGAGPARRRGGGAA